MVGSRLVLELMASWKTSPLHRKDSLAWHDIEDATMAKKGRDYGTIAQKRLILNITLRHNNALFDETILDNVHPKTAYI